MISVLYEVYFLALMRILLVDDDQSLIALLTRNLSDQHYAVDTAPDGEAAWAYVSAFAYDLIVLDVMLPKLDGISLCRKLRAHDYQMPILLLTAQDSSTDKIKGLDAGADDYVVKPCDLEELTARIRALLRRDAQALPTVLQWGDLKLDPSTGQVSYGSSLLALTPKEYALLALFLRNPNRVFSLGAILDNVWSADELPGVETVRTHVKGLRRKLKAAGAPPKLIETVYGLGYRSPSPPEPMAVASETRAEDTGQAEGATAAPTAMPATSPDQTSDADAQMLAAIAQTWLQYKGQMMERLEVLEQAALVLSSQSLSSDQQQEAKRMAHSLAGTLGTFGFGEGSRLARELEQFLKQANLGPAQGPCFGERVAALRENMQGSPAGHDSLSASGPLPVLLVIDEDRQRTQALQATPAAQAVRIVIAPSLAAAQTQIQSERPHAVLLSLAAADDAPLPRAEGLVLLETLAQHSPPIPVVVTLSRDRWLDRIEAIRHGARLCLEPSLPPDQVLAVVTQVLDPPGQGAKVLIVDDDPQLLQALPTLLAPWGFELTTLADPQQFWTVLTSVEPALLVLDVDMPGINGIELCQLLRNDAKWCQLPVVFLTAHQDEQTQDQIFTSGGDDYLTKPVVATELATRMLNRLERVKLIRNYPV